MELTDRKKMAIRLREWGSLLLVLALLNVVAAIWMMTLGNVPAALIALVGAAMLAFLRTLTRAIALLLDQ